MSDGAKKVAIVTGAGRGIGRATAIALARADYNLSLVARTLGDVQETATAAGGGLALAADVSNLDEIEKVVLDTVASFGRVDVVVNNAGYAPVRLIDDITPKEWQKTIDTNLSATFFFCKTVWPIMKQQGGGVIVNLSSLSSRDPFTGLGAYGAAKAGINLLGIALGREGEPHGIRVHTVAPGAVETGMFRRLLTPEQYPTDKTLDPDDVAQTILACIQGGLQHTSGEVVWMHKRLK